MHMLKRLLLAVSICCLVPTANAAPKDDAKAAYENGDYEQALKVLRPFAAKGGSKSDRYSTKSRDGYSSTELYSRPRFAAEARLLR